MVLTKDNFKMKKNLMLNQIWKLTKMSKQRDREELEAMRLILKDKNINRMILFNPISKVNKTYKI